MKYVLKFAIVNGVIWAVIFMAAAYGVVRLIS